MQPIKLSIPTPCHEDWNKMKPNEQGRFCGSCAKTVVDFSVMTDAQLIFYFENLKNENVCGRVYPDQLNRAIEKSVPPQPRKKIFFLWQYAAALFLFFTKGFQAKSQGETKILNPVQTDTIKRPLDIYQKVGKIRVADNRPEVHLLPSLITQFFITDENGEPVAGASIKLMPSGKWMTTDSTGKINLGKTHSTKEVFISAIGYHNKDVLLKDIEGNSIRLTRSIVTLGEVAVKCDTGVQGRLVQIAGGISVQRSDEIKEKTPLITSPVSSDVSFSIFPNPVQKGKEVSFTVYAEETKGYKMSIVSLDGKLMLQQNIPASAKGRPMKISVPTLWSSGTYIMSMANENGEILQSEKIILL